MTKIDCNYLSIPYKNKKKTLFKRLLGPGKTKKMSPSESKKGLISLPTAKPYIDLFG